MKIENKIKNAWQNQKLIHTDTSIQSSVNEAIEMLDKGIIRVAEPVNDEWQVNEWVRQAVLLYFKLAEGKETKAGPLTFYDKVDVKSNFKENNIRVVPPAVARYGSYISSNVILMPSYVNIGAYIDKKSMIDIGAAIGSCAQIGKSVHVSAGAVIGGVLEPIQDTPVIIEDNAFIGAKSVIVEGVKIGYGAVLGAGVTITKTTRIIDVTADEKIEYKGIVPKLAIVVPGTIEKKFSAGSFNINCAYIIGKRNKNTDAKVSINEILR